MRHSIILMMLLAACGEQSAAPAVGSPDAGQADAAATAVSRPRVILMIGDGMGRGQIEAAGPLFMTTLPRRGEIITSSLSGTTDSAAAATAMATGVKTFNTYVGVDRDGVPVETLVESAHRLGLSAGVVTTSSLAHATPAAFSAHRGNREDYAGIAEDQALSVRPDVMLGGGAVYLNSLYAEMEAGGYQVVASAAELAAVEATQASRVAGVFAYEHLDYVLDRSADTTQPTLTEMSMKAIELLDSNDDGFFLMIEGARIDMASHANDYDRTVSETRAFDEAVAAVAAWAAQQGDVTLLVTADHECGGLRPSPEVTWRWDLHTNARVDIFGMGPGSEQFDGATLDHTWVHAIIAAQLEERATKPPPVVLTPDGHLLDLRYEATSQSLTTDFGVGFNQFESLYVDVDEHGLAIGLEGLFEWNRNAIVILLDVDFGEGTGHTGTLGEIVDDSSRADAVLSSLELKYPASLGADLAIVAWGGTEAMREDLLKDSGLRGLSSPYGDPSDLGWHPVAMSFGESVRSNTSPLVPTRGEGFEAHLPWEVLYPDLAGAVPPNATVALTAVLVNDDGAQTSNQALPPFDLGSGSSVTAPTTLPGVVKFSIDIDGDGIADGSKPPVVLAAP
jgi:alkaline phosphatase